MTRQECIKKWIYLIFAAEILNYIKIISNFDFYKQCIKVQSILNLKCIKFIGILLKRTSGKRKMMHSSFYWNQPSRPIPLRRPSGNSPARARARPAAVAHHGPACAPLRSPAPALAAVGRGNLGPGRERAVPHGPKEARWRADRLRPSDSDRRLRACCGRSKTPGAVLPKTLAHFFSPRSPGAFFFPPEHASEWRPAATERAAPRRAPSPARASTAR
jgi:hypothetical protein